MKRIILTLGIFLLSTAQLALSQNFNYTAADTELPGAPGELTQFYSFIENLEPGEVTFWVEMETDIPPGWTAQFCTYVCFPPWVTVDSNYVIAGSETDSVTVDVYPDTSGSEGWVTMTVYPAGHPELGQTIDFHTYFPGGVEPGESLPHRFDLLEAFPNPFNPSVTLRFDLPGSADADLSIFDLSGRQVDQIYNGKIKAGLHEFQWQPGDLSSGIYVARLRYNGNLLARKIVYLR